MLVPSVFGFVFLSDRFSSMELESVVDVVVVEVPSDFNGDWPKPNEFIPEEALSQLFADSSASTIARAGSKS